MNKIGTLAQKELSGYFKSPVAYVILIATLSIFNIFFYMIIDQNREATLRDVFLVMEFMFVFLTPLLTMRIFAEEKSAGTMEFLMTTPTSPTAIVLGKYLGSLIFFSLILLMTGVYYIIIECFGQPDRLATLTGFLGLWLEGALFVSIGILASSWTRSQVVAAIVSYLILFALYFSPGFVRYVSVSLQGVIRYISTINHAANFTVGLITISDFVYYLSGILFCLILTRISIDHRLWK
jgi:ABC-2 type transport system permease protein